MRGIVSAHSGSWAEVHHRMVTSSTSNGWAPGIIMTTCEIDFPSPSLQAALVAALMAELLNLPLRIVCAHDDPTTHVACS